jgi:hypothetical protein
MDNQQTARMNMPTPLIFVHIPKTGGTTLRTILRKQYGNENLVNVRAFRPEILERRIHRKVEDIEQSSVLLGHMIAGGHRHLSQERPYVTFLREAVDRVISDYHYVLRTPTHDFYDPVATENYSLADYVKSGVTIYTNNVQTRMIAGVGRDIPFGECTDDMLERAIDQIESHFPVVGITNRFEESVVLMRRRLNWGIPMYMTRNRTAGRPRRHEVSESTRHVIREFNQLDVQLYDYVTDRLASQLSKVDSNVLERELQILRLTNAIYSPSARAYIWLRKKYNELAGRDTW